VQNPEIANPGIDVKLPEGVEVRINRPHQYINVEVTMPPSNGGQDGLCGNSTVLAMTTAWNSSKRETYAWLLVNRCSSIHNKTQFQGVAKCLELAVLLIEA